MSEGVIDLRIALAVCDTCSAVQEVKQPVRQEIGARIGDCRLIIGYTLIGIDGQSEESEPCGGSLVFRGWLYIGTTP